jgi:hypothetical protein
MKTGFEIEVFFFRRKHKMHGNLFFIFSQIEKIHTDFQIFFSARNYFLQLV